MLITDPRSQPKFERRERVAYLEGGGGHDVDKYEKRLETVSEGVPGGRRGRCIHEGAGGDDAEEEEDHALVPTQYETGAQL